MKVVVEIELDESWNDYKDVHPDLFIEDMLPPCKRMDGIVNVKLIEIKDE